MAAGMLNALYNPLQQRHGELANIDDESRRKLLDVMTLDILSRVFMGLEDLGKLLLASCKPPRDLPATMLDAGQNDSLAAITRYSQKTESELMRVFPFLHPRGIYGFQGEEEDAVREYAFEHAMALRKMLSFAAEFIQRHTWAYNIYKHGISVILAMPGPPLPDGIDGLIPIFTSGGDLQNAKFILTGHTVAEKLSGFVSSVVGISKMIVERRIQMAELGGTPPPLLCHMSEDAGQLRLTPWSWVQSLSDRTVSLSNAAFNKIVDKFQSTRINAKLELKVDRTRVEDWVKFYSCDWRVV